MKIIIFFIALVLLLTSFLYSQHEGHIKYQCPMHPQVISDRPGKCPICGMNLAEVTSQEMTGKSIDDSIVKITSIQEQLVGVTTEEVVYRPLMRMIRTVAEIAFDPELYKAEEEFIQAHRIKEAAKLTKSVEVSQRLDALTLAAVFKLKLLGLSEAQIEELKTKAQSDPALIISDALMPYAWVYLTLYEYDLGSVTVGDHVVLQAITYPGEEFGGKIVAIDPVLNMSTRSVRARVQVDNPEAKLKPNMYADAVIHIDLGNNLALPREAVLDTGLRKIVYIEVGKGQFKAQEVEVGPESISVVDNEERKFFPVIKGLQEKDIVVTKGNFLIDSQSQLTGGMSALWGGATEIKTEHKH